MSGTQPDDRDTPWKLALDRWLEPFARLLFPELHAAVDWTRSWTALDGELPPIVRDAELGKRLADRLYQVHLRDGAEAVLYIHIEVQGQKDPEFTLRVEVYHRRLRDKFGESVVSLAVLADDDPDWRPDEYRFELVGCRRSLRFPTAKLLDHDTPEGRAALDADPNPFAVVVLGHLESLRTRGLPGERFAAKKRLLKGLRRRGLQRDDRVELTRLLDWLLAMPKELEVALKAQLDQEEGKDFMPYVTSWERIAEEKGLEKGREEGREKVERTVLAVLEARFGAVPDEAVALVRAGSASPTFDEVAREAALAPTLEQFVERLRARG